jgi:hypothetical protein
MYNAKRANAKEQMQNVQMQKNKCKRANAKEQIQRSKYEMNKCKMQNNN